MRPHGNSHGNIDLQHLYEIYDIELQEVYKYGICGEPLSLDGTSPRANRQVREFNRVVGYHRFTAKVLLTDISGRKKAEETEEYYVQHFEQQHGRRPRGNP
jgi:hypothetical protein